MVKNNKREDLGLPVHAKRETEDEEV